MKHSFAPNPDLEICPPLRRSQNCRWGRQTQPGKSVAINKEQRAYSDPSLYIEAGVLHPDDAEAGHVSPAEAEVVLAGAGVRGVRSSHHRRDVRPETSRQH